MNTLIRKVVWRCRGNGGRRGDGGWDGGGGRRRGVMSESRSRDTRETVKPLQGSYRIEKGEPVVIHLMHHNMGWSLRKHHTTTVTGW